MDEILPGPGLKPLVSLRAHRRLACATVACVLALGAPLAWLKGAPRYQSEATVLVAPRYMKNLHEDQELVFESNSQYRQFVEQQVHSIVRFDVLHRALSSPGGEAVRRAWMQPGERERHAIERLQAALVVQPVPDTYLIRIALEGTRPAGLDTLVNAVTHAYLDTTHDEQLFGADTRTQALQQRERALQAQIVETAAKRNAIARDLNLTSFSDNITNPFDKLVADQRHALEEARQQRMSADAALASFRQRGDTQITVRSVQDNVLNDPGLNSLKSNLYKRYGDLTTQMSGLRPEHPGYAAAHQEKEEIEREIKSQDGRLETRVRGNIEARLQGTSDQAHALENGLQQELSALEARSSAYAALFQQALSLTGDMEQARKEVEQIRDRLGFLQLESGAPGFVRGVSPALPADTPYGTGRKKLLLLLLLAALGAGVATPLMADLLDRRVRTVNVAQTLMGIPPAGWQIEVSDTASRLFADEQNRRLAGTLIRFGQRQGQRIFGFCGLKPGAGCTTLLLTLANTLRLLGFRVVVVEANGFKPDARYAGAPAGLGDVLSGQCTPAQAIAPPTADLPARVAFAGGHDGPAAARGGIHSLGALRANLEHWASEADFVLVDMPPLLVAADAELLLGCVGHAMMVLEAGASTRGEVLRARRMLQTLDPEAVGFVLNRVRPFDGGGYLRSLMVEFLSRRKHGEVMTLPGWRLWLAGLRLRQH
ncbi:hypothetical protein LBW62_13485 [Ralstonia solanacearum]|uniref:GumC family protein n=1 Tax=Ralstonia solanacearum TaxID=305 RepID=UPI0005C724ED|nr:hypothetical protein [Ralstonia solanacearum]MDB0542239.1 hypothetical protein [Ralstonia solanacearum]MDB0552489.1 hypothetical protein [Ralstonia solanacearum]MDB0557203.1 hypothetical protein [Ralstonia solanacearum]